MTASSYEYARRRQYIFERDVAYHRMVQAQEVAERYHKYLSNPELMHRAYDARERADDAAETWLRLQEKVEYLDAVIDATLLPERRTRAPDAPTPLQILVRQQKDQARRADIRASFKFRRELVHGPVVASKPEQPEFLISPDALQTESDARRAKEAQSAARKERRRLKALARAQAWRAKKNEDDQS
jgi:hypothetical protein